MFDLGLFLRYSKALGFKRSWIGLIFFLQFTAVLFEGIGISMFLPILQYLQEGVSAAELAERSELWRRLTDGFAMIGLEVNLASLLSVAFAMFIMRQVFQYLRLLFTNKVKFGLIRDVRRRAFQLFVHADLGFHDRIRTGNFVNELTIEVTSATGALVAYINFVGCVLMGVVFAGWMFVVSPAMTASAVGIFLVTALAMAGLMRRSRKAGTTVTEINQEVGQFLLERLHALRLIRLAGMQKAESEQIRRLTDVQNERLVRLAAITAATQVLAEPIILLGAFTLLFIAVNFLGQPLEVVLLIFAVMFRMLPVVKEALVRRQAFLASLASVDVVTERIRELAAFREMETGDQAPGRLQDGVVFEGVFFDYVADDAKMATPALHDVDLTIPARAVTAIVGPSGAGKSTLIDMIPRLRTPHGGRILYDGVPLENFSLTELRRSVAFVPQEPLILNVSIAEHIRYGNPSASEEDLRRAAALANAAEFIEKMPNGYDEQVGEGGKRLSGGQRQRLDLARALVGRAPILILDEPTSNLDMDSERRFTEAIRRIRSETDIAVIVIAHRLNTIRMADFIAVMEQGRVVETGSHSELIARGGWYARMGNQTRHDPAAAQP